MTYHGQPRLQDDLHLAAPEGGPAHLHQLHHVAQLSAQLPRRLLVLPRGGGEQTADIGRARVKEAQPIPALIFPSPPVYQQARLHNIVRESRFLITTPALQRFLFARNLRIA